MPIKLLKSCCRTKKSLDNCHGEQENRGINANAVFYDNINARGVSNRSLILVRESVVLRNNNMLERPQHQRNLNEHSLNKN